jgi:hypothetical protein
MRIGKIVALGALAVGASIVVAPKADAAYIIDVTQDGNNVVATGSGSMNLSGLTLFGSFAGGAKVGGLSANFGIFEIGSSSGTDIYDTISGPGAHSFQSAGDDNPSSSTGPFVGIQGNGGDLFVPQGYVSGQSLGTTTATFDNTTIAGMDLIPGTYTWTWSGDSLTLDIPGAASTVPEPASMALLGTGLAALGLNRRRRVK